MKTRLFFLMFFLVGNVFSFSYATLDGEKLFTSALFSDYDVLSGRFFKGLVYKDQKSDFHKSLLNLGMEFDKEADKWVSLWRKSRKEKLEDLKKDFLSARISIPEFLERMQEISGFLEKKRLYFLALQKKYDRAVDKIGERVIFSDKESQDIFVQRVKKISKEAENIRMEKAFDFVIATPFLLHQVKNERFRYCLRASLFQFDPQLGDCQLSLEREEFSPPDFFQDSDQVEEITGEILKRLGVEK